MKVVCEHCGLPFSVTRVAPGRPVYCCSGCALAANVPVDAHGNFPVNTALAAALGAGFVFFNQALFWLLALLLAREADGVVNAGRFTWASLAAGVVLVCALAVFQARAGARRGIDRLVLAACGGLLAVSMAGAGAGCAVAGNACLAAWSLRGLGRGKSARERSGK